MLAIDVLLLGYFYKFNSANLDAMEIMVDYNKIYEKLNDIYIATIEEAKRRRVEAVCASGFIKEINGNILSIQVKYLALGSYIESIDYLLSPLYDYFNVLGLEKARTEFFIYYHPQVRIKIASKVINGIIIDKTLFGQEDFDVKNILRINTIRKPNKETIKDVMKAILRYAFHKNVLANTSDSTIELCLEGVIKSIDEKIFEKILFGIHEKIDTLNEKLCEVNEKINYEYGKDVDYISNLLGTGGIKRG
jgi:hypothetical protein